MPKLDKSLRFHNSTLQQRPPSSSPCLQTSYGSEHPVILLDNNHGHIVEDVAHGRKTQNVATCKTSGRANITDATCPIVVHYLWKFDRHSQIMCVLSDPSKWGSRGNLSRLRCRPAHVHFPSSLRPAVPLDLSVPVVLLYVSNFSQTCTALTKKPSPFYSTLPPWFFNGTAAMELEVSRILQKYSQNTVNTDYRKR